MTGGPILRVEGLRKSYGSLTVLDGVSFDMNRGETKVVMGSSGAGKSTLLRCINLLIPPDNGKVCLDGADSTDPRLDIDRFRASIGMVFQDFNLFAHLSALDNVRIGLRRVRGMGKKAATERAMAELARVDLAAKAASYPAELSGGQQQRVSIARALAMDPKLILFDEPTSALDPELMGEVLRVMIRLAKDGVTMLVASHEVAFARSVADQIIFLDGGRILEQGPPDAVMGNPRNPRLREFFRSLAEVR